MTKSAILSGMLLMPVALCAETYYWTGGAKESASDSERTPSMETPANWALADGTPASSAPTKDDDIVFTNAVSDVIWSECTDIISSSYRLMTYNTITLTNEGSVTIKARTDKVDGRNSQLGFPKNGIFNYTDGGTLAYSRVAKSRGGSAANPAVYLIYVENQDAAVNMASHLQPQQHSKFVKDGDGSFRVLGSSSGRYYASSETWELVGGTLKFPRWTASDYTTKAVSFMFKGDKSKCLSLSEKNGSYCLGGLLHEEDVTTTTHLLTDEGNGATLALTNIVDSSKNSLKDCRFSGTLAGTLSIVYDVQEWYGDEPRPALTLAKGTSTSTGTLTVRNGTVNLAEGANYSSLSSVSVEANGKLCVSDGAVLNTAISVASGGELNLGEGIAIRTPSFSYGGSTFGLGVYDKDSGVGITGAGRVYVEPVIAVNYDPTEKTAVPVDLRASNYTHEMLSQRLDVALSAAIALPDHSTNKILVARFAAGSGLTGEDFNDVSPKTYDLPYTWFESKIEEGETRLYLCSRPVVEGHVLERVGEGSSATHYFMKEEHKDLWSDNKVPHAGADYLLRCDSNRTPFSDKVENGEKSFPGESLTLARTRYATENKNWSIALRCYEMPVESDKWFGIYAGFGRNLRGVIYLCDSDVENGTFFRGMSGDAQILSAVAGPGCIGFSRAFSSTAGIQFTVLGDNSALSGPVKVRGMYSGTVWNDITIVVTNANALGGAMASPTARGLELSGFSGLVVRNSTTFAAANREVFLEDGLRLSVAEGQTFAIRNPIRCRILGGADAETSIPDRCLVRKTGSGVFALGAEVRPCDVVNGEIVSAEANGTNNLVRVAEGGVQPLTETAFDNLQLCFEDGTSIVVNPNNAATQTHGLRLKDCVPQFADGAAVALRVADGYEPSGESFSVAFLTVPAAAPDLLDRLKAPRLRTASGGIAGRLTKENVSVDGVAMTRYSVEYAKTGFVFVVR
ncbi:MAG: hypothetical protein E7046_11185 [Lentisphaerae bacterium]|nr:hypothetical protein [Lentisphaerota bacterium]